MVSSIVSKMRDKIKDTPLVNLISYLQPKNKEVTAAFRVLSTKEQTPLSISTAISEIFNAQLIVVPGTVKLMTRNPGYVTVSAVLSVNTVKKPVFTEQIDGFRCIARNLFMDDRDSSTWNMVENNGQKMLVRKNHVETDNDLLDLLSSVSSQSINTQEHRHLEACASSIQKDVGTFLSYVHNGEHRLGIVVDNQKYDLVGILSQSSDTPVYVNAGSIVQVFDAQKIKEQIKVPTVSESLASIAAQRPSIDTIVDFYKKIYGENADYFKRFEQEIRSYKFAQ